MRSEWILANNKNNELCNVVFGDNVARLTQAEYRRYYSTNGKALDAFFDICDELKGDYPKDFKFTGWHPHCRCYATPLLKTPEELAADNQRIMQHKKE